MKKIKLLSGHELVAKGAIKSNVSLPEHGLKDVSSNGSWLEQKQIQCALEARKHLIEVERIEKCGMLSHAKWREDLMLAEVTQQTGGYWQYLGHHIDKCLYLKPEEALYLIEVNCLLLKYNDVIVSLQQAYSLLLNEKISIAQYKVYAYLSRLGYKVFRHVNPIPSKSNVSENQNKNKTEDNINKLPNDTNMKEEEMEQILVEHEIQCNEISDTTNKSNNSNVQESEIGLMETNTVLSNDNETRTNNSFEEDMKIHQNLVENYNNKLQKLKSRKHHGSQHIKDIHKYYDNIPDMFQKETVTVLVPSQEYIPKTIVLKNTNYKLKIHNIKTKNIQPPSNDSDVYSLTDEDTGARRIENTIINRTPNNPPQFISSYTQFSRYPHYNQFNTWRQRRNFNYYQFNLFFQRPLFQNPFFQQRFQFFPRTPPPFLRPHSQTSLLNYNANCMQTNSSRKRVREKQNCKIFHLNNIQKLANRLKIKKFTTGEIFPNNIELLQRMVQIYNDRYKERIRITDSLEIVNDEHILETIELEDDEETKHKKSRLDTPNDSYEENFMKIRKMALKLGELEAKEMVTARHRRALSSIIKTFNNSYNADIYMNENYEILDHKNITLDSSSDSDCVISESPPPPSHSKKLRNPFNILKQLSEKNKLSPTASTSKQIDIDDTNTEETQSKQEYEYSEFITKSFSKNWLPNQNDFGRPEIPPRSLMISRIVDTNKEEFLYEFMKNQPYLDNWIDIKISFFKSMEVATAVFQSDIVKSNSFKTDSIIKPEDCTNMESVLKKLSIITNNKDVDSESYLSIDFDVYNRDVQNFKKSNRPIPHFRVICVNESSSFPLAADVAALNSKYVDEVPIVFAAVGVSSISLLQVIPNDLPMYIPGTDLA
ncbi:tRNA splicing endonuclease subunit 54 [Aphomia sociella]